MAEPSAYPGAPRWVKVSGAITLLVLVVIAVVLHTRSGGRHGPGRHVLNDGPTPRGAQGHVTDLASRRHVEGASLSTLGARL